MTFRLCLLGGWPTFAPPQFWLPHASRFSKRGHHGLRHLVHSSHTEGGIPWYLSECPIDSIATTAPDICTLSPPVVTNAARWLLAHLSPTTFFSSSRFEVSAVILSPCST